VRWLTTRIVGVDQLSSSSPRPRYPLHPLYPIQRLRQRPLACLLKGDCRGNMKGASVEVKIGITDSPRELVFISAQTPGEVEELVTTALGDGADVLSLTDEKGRRFVIHAAKIAYVEIGVADARRVGFGIGTARHG
jgi:hypothetical protein